VSEGILDGVVGRGAAVGELRVRVQPANISKKMAQTRMARFITIQSWHRHTSATTAVPDALTTRISPRIRMQPAQRSPAWARDSRHPVASTKGLNLRDDQPMSILAAILILTGLSWLMVGLTFRFLGTQGRVLRDSADFGPRLSDRYRRWLNRQVRLGGVGRRMVVPLLPIPIALIIVGALVLARS
jgi:hypothetical protein